MKQNRSKKTPSQQKNIDNFFGQEQGIGKRNKFDVSSMSNNEFSSPDKALSNPVRNKDSVYKIDVNKCSVGKEAYNDGFDKDEMSNITYFDMQDTVNYRKKIKTESNNGQNTPTFTGLVKQNNAADLIRLRPKMRKVYDPIHKFIGFDDQTWEMIDTPVFQRLRNLKQLGFCNMVFPGATHSRFEHSLGVSHLAEKFVRKAFESSREEINWDQADYRFYEKSIRLAGLFHDLGHGPFSHGFEGVIHTIDPSSTWSHEDASRDLFDYMIDNYQIDNIDESQRKLIKQLITPENDFIKSKKHPKWIFEIVANYRTSIDVDRWDYMTRDPYMVGIQDLKFDNSIFFENLLVVNDEVMFNKKMVPKINDFFHNRYRLFKHIYLNQTSFAWESMFQDALVLCNDFKTGSRYNFLEIINNPEDYIN